MTKVQFIKTAGGEELAVLPRAEFERLTALANDEDIGVGRIVEKARAAIAAGDDIVLPKAIVDRLAAGDNPLRVLREWRGMMQVELAASLGITQGYLSDVETGKRKGPVALHQKIARELGVPIALLLPIAVSAAEADPKRVAKRRQAVQGAIRERRRR